MISRVQTEIRHAHIRPAVFLCRVKPSFLVTGNNIILYCQQSQIIALSKTYMTYIYIPKFGFLFPAFVIWDFKSCQIHVFIFLDRRKAVCPATIFVCRRTTSSSIPILNHLPDCKPIVENWQNPDYKNILCKRNTVKSTERMNQSWNKSFAPALFAVKNYGKTTGKVWRERYSDLFFDW